MRKFLIGLLLLITLGPVLQARTWTSADGSHTFRGALVAYHPPNVSIRGEGKGKDILVKDTMLCVDDRKFCQLAVLVMQNVKRKMPFRVLQKLPEGLIVEEFPTSLFPKHLETWMIRAGADAQRPIRLRGVYEANLYEVGAYSYHASNGSVSFLRSFTTSLELAVGVADSRFVLEGTPHLEMQSQPQLEGNGPPADSKQKHPPASSKLPEVEGLSNTSADGFAITSIGHVVTNAHVVANAKGVVVHIKTRAYPATVVAVDGDCDIAILKIEGRTIPLQVSATEPVHLGDAVATAGFALPDAQGGSSKLTRGIISGLKGPRDSPRCYQIEAASQFGTAGGPLVNDNRCVVGVVASGAPSQNVNFALKADYLMVLVEQVPGLAKAMAAENYAKSDSMEAMLENSTYSITCEMK